jgi:transposase-like protein
LTEWGLHADHVTVWRWVQRYAPEMERRLCSRLKPTNDSWRMDDTYVRVKGKWVYLYRAVDSEGATIDFLLSAKRDTVAVKRFLAKALGGANHPAPRVINTDKDAAYSPAIVQLKPMELWMRTVAIDRCSISTTFWNRIIGRSSAGYAQVSIFVHPGELAAQSPVTKRSI